MGHLRMWQRCGSFEGLKRVMMITKGDSQSGPPFVLSLSFQIHESGICRKHLPFAELDGGG